jgi:hypothetical protein
MQLVRKGEGAHQLLLGSEVEPGSEHGASSGRLVALHAPAARPRQQAVDREPVRILVQRQRLELQVDLAAEQREARPSEPIRPRVQQGDAHRRALGDVRADPAAPAEQLLPTVTEGAADHSGGGYERSLEPPAIARDRQRRETLDGPPADHRDLPSGTLGSVVIRVTRQRS